MVLRRFEPPPPSLHSINAPHQPTWLSHLYIVLAIPSLLETFLENIAQLKYRINKKNLHAFLQATLLYTSIFDLKVTGSLITRLGP